MAKRVAAKRMRAEGELLVITAGVVQTRGRGLMRLDPAALSARVQEFVERVQDVVKSIRDTDSAFQLHEFEVSAEITAQGRLALLGTGGEVGGTAGLKFVFQRKSGTP